MKDVLVSAVEALREAEVESAELDARLLLAFVLKTDRAGLLSLRDRELTHEELSVYRDCIGRRAMREPVSRILGHREFWGLSFGLNEETLDPRPDSETVISACLEIFPEKESALRILDLGTGSGCLLLSLLFERPEAEGIGVDISEAAVEMARENAESLGFSDRASFVVQDWFGADQGETLGMFDLIVSNPPYIASDDIYGLMPEVRDFDPVRALDGGASGLEPYERIIPDLPLTLRSGGAVVFEVGIGQARDVADLLEQQGFSGVRCVPDLNGIDRCVVGVWR